MELLWFKALGCVWSGANSPSSLFLVKKVLDFLENNWASGMSWNGWGIWGSQAGRGTWAGGGGNQSQAAATPKQSNHRRLAGGRKQLILERPQDILRPKRPDLHRLDKFLKWTYFHRSRGLVLATVWSGAWEVFYFFFLPPWSQPWWHKVISWKSYSRHILGNHRLHFTMPCGNDLTMVDTENDSCSSRTFTNLQTPQTVWSYYLSSIF